MVKKTNKGNRITRTERERIALENAKKGLQSEGAVLHSGVEKQIVQIPTIEGIIFQSREDYLTKGIRAHEGSLELDLRLLRLFEETRDGRESPVDYRNELINDPNISCEQIAKAISLGIESWGFSIYSKER